MTDELTEEQKKVLAEAATKSAEIEAAKKAEAAATQNINKKSAVEIAQETVKQLEEQNKIMAENLKKQEQLMQQDILGGRSKMSQPKRTADQLIDDDARRMLKGTGYDDQLFPLEK